MTELFAAMTELFAAMAEQFAAMMELFAAMMELFAAMTELFAAMAEELIDCPHCGQRAGTIKPSCVYCGNRLPSRHVMK